jgi:hypothetical protein
LSKILPHPKTTFLITNSPSIYDESIKLSQRNKFLWLLTSNYNSNFLILVVDFIPKRLSHAIFVSRVRDRETFSTLNFAVMEKSDITVIIGVVVPAGVFLLIFLVVCLVRRSRNTPTGYSQVSHTLDEEEIEFKRMIEMQSDNIDDLFSGAAMSHEDVEFDNKEIDRLNMLEQYRDRLVAGAQADSLSSAAPLTAEAEAETSEDIRV